jgi:hypothetical protein
MRHAEDIIKERLMDGCGMSAQTATRTAADIVDDLAAAYRIEPLPYVEEAPKLSLGEILVGLARRDIQQKKVMEGIR